MATIDPTPLPSLGGTNLLQWRLVDRGDRVELSSRFPTAWVVFGLVVCGLLSGLGLGIASLGEESHDGFRLAWLIVTALLGLVGPAVGYLSYRLGPRLLVDLSRRTIALPKLSQTWPLDAVAGFQVIDSESIRQTGDGSETLYGCQLNLVVSERGAISRHRLTEGEGQGMAMRLKELAAQIGEKTGLPLVSDVRNGVERIASHPVQR